MRPVAAGHNFETTSYEKLVGMADQQHEGGWMSEYALPSFANTTATEPCAGAQTRTLFKPSTISLAEIQHANLFHSAEGFVCRASPHYGELPSVQSATALETACH